MSEPFQVIKIAPATYHVIWYGEPAYWVHRSLVWQGKWRAFSKRPLLRDDTDAEIKPLLARLKAACEKAIAV